MRQPSLKTSVLLALLLPCSLVLAGGIWPGTDQHTHRSGQEGGLIPWIPTGFIGCYAGPTPPINTIEAYGQAVSRTTYATLFGHLGVTHGSGDGSTTFNLPDLRGRVVIGLDNMGGTSANRVTHASGSTIGGTAGSETITIAQMPAHTHTVGASTNANGGTPASQQLFTDDITETTSSTGGGQPYNPPFMALKCVIGT